MRTTRPVHRRSTTVGYACGTDTKLRIIHASIGLFAVNGFERTSTREIARRAGVNAPALQYYFDGKEGLYVSCAEYIIEQAGAIFAPLLASIRARLAHPLPRDELIECVCGIMDRAVDFISVNPEMETWARFMEDCDREGSAPSVGEIIERGLRRELTAVLSELIGRITGRGAADADTRIRVVTLGSQVSLFHIARQRTLQAIGWTEIREEQIASIRAIIRHQTHAALQAAQLH